MKILAKVFFWGIALLVISVPLFIRLSSVYDFWMYFLSVSFWISIAYATTIRITKFGRYIPIVTLILLIGSHIIHGKYINPSNHRFEPIVKTPGEEVEAQGTQAHP